ncbi:hypothetical protein RYX36_020922 [Vicia faba]
MLDLQTGLFTLRQIKAATNNFDVSNKIGEGRFGPVYKGCLPNGTLIAVKQLSSKSKQGNGTFVEGRLGSDFNKKEAMVMINVALLCTNVTSNLRPSMSLVVSFLEGRTVVPEFVSDSSQVMDEKKLEVMRQYYLQTQSQCLISDGPWTATSSSAVDLDSSYWEERN